MDFGANIFGVGTLADPEAFASVARLAEDLGNHSVFIAPRFLNRHSLTMKAGASRQAISPLAEILALAG